ncbi:beta,beta-carotene 15,15'-dioxygenase-like isoform X2 [Lytechinus variegatus]|uniref:beta,beta-carotene 15,15'-dioxygenase-like isoform X2 n=1 Tax=Lytechinus variegatus TaxID=7654 RepID=UPI001BB1B202|nr:beta,beta-carotene 15,15'-dioxygenase-like isoform X2 [Lytechinus variegatus]
MAKVVNGKTVTSGQMDKVVNGKTTTEDKSLLKKIYQSIQQETSTPIETKIIGKVPTWLKGNLLRNGPGKFEIGEDRVDHFFDGLSFLHRFIIEEGGKVKYQGRFLRSDIYEKALKHQRLTFNGFGTPARHPDPCKTLFQRIFSFFKIELPDNCNVNWLKVGDEYYTMTETPLIKKMNVDKLDVLDTVNLEKIVGVHTATAHPHVGHDGTVYNLGTAMSRQCKYCIIKVPPSNNQNGEDAISTASILSSIPASSYTPTYYHSFGITENYIVFVEQPLHINMFKVFFGRLLNKPMSHCMNYYPDAKVRFHLIRRDDGTVVETRYLADAFFCFHHCNAYETSDGKHVVIDMCCFDDDAVMMRATMESIRRGDLNVEDCWVRRFVLPLGNQTKVGENLVTMAGSEASAKLNNDGSFHCVPEQLCDINLELPQVNYADYNGRDYTYLYGVGGTMQTLHKVNVKTHQVQTWSSPGCFPSEPIFVGAPTKESEDDGVILSCVTNLADDKEPPYLLVLDARTFKEIARAVIPVPVSTFGIHGIFV